MNDDSAFFGNAHIEKRDDTCFRELIHSSQGGWTELYRVDKSGKFRVLKALKPQFRGQPMYELLLRKEFEIGYNLQHPGISEVYGYGPIPDLGNCIELEWVDGTTMSNLILSGHLSSGLSRRIALQLCDILSYLHSKQVIHRDLKPSNIMVTHNGRNVKLIDFGLSDTDSFSILKSPAGTLSFAAPELVNGKSVDARADIYSLGKILALMNGRFAFIAKKCSKNNPDDRYPNAESVKDSIKRIPLLRLIPVLVVALAVFAAWSLTRTAIQNSPVQEPEQSVVSNQQDLNTDTTISDPSVIDELFRQATDMINTGNR